MLSSTVGNDLEYMTTCVLPSLDSFADLNPLLPESTALSENMSLSSLFPNELECFRNKQAENEEVESEWGEENGNAFDAFLEEDSRN